MKTTPTLILFLQLREAFRKHAYDDKFPNRELTADTPIEGTLTIGYGTTEYPDGRKVKWNDTVSKQEALDYLTAYVRTEIEPVLDNLIHVPLKGCQYDALGSCIYQFGAAEVSGWRLIQKINRGASWQEIALEWVDGTVMWQGAPLFWGRRIMELFMFFDLDWKAGDNVPAGTSVISALETMGMSDSKAVADLNTAQLEPLEDFAREHGKVVVREATPEVAKKATTLAPKKKTIHVEVPVDAEPKLMEDSKTHKGLSKAESGKEAVIVGTTVTGVTAGLPVAKELAGFFKAYDLQVLLTAGLAFGGVLLLVGAWRWWAGQQIAYEGRQTASQPKV
jgi:GH24 family phage-related lysozyme (muramidase)